MFLFKTKIIILILVLFSCSSKNTLTLRPEGLKQHNAVTIEMGNLIATFVDNQKWGEEHKAGYNGVGELFHLAQDSSPFVPYYAGFNLEHIFSGDSLDQLFEPIKHPMNLFQKADNEVLLYQDATPLSGVESLTEFKIVAPHYIDITFRCIFHNSSFFKHDYAGLFWASYINRPDDKKIYFKGISSNNPEASWIDAFSTEHGTESTHKRIDDDFEFFFVENFNARLASHFSDYRYIESYYFGKFHNMAVAYLFDSDEVIRFSQSPTGGGETNPAWDFQYLIPSPQMEKEYSFKARMIYKPFLNAEDMKSEYDNWINEQ